MAVAESSTFGVPLWKVALVTAATVGWSGGVFYDAWRAKDHWPLSAFAMYSDKARANAVRDVMYGVSDAREFQLSTGHTYPVAGTRLNFMLRYMHGERGRKGLRIVQKVYEIQRQKGAHDDPPLTAIRTERQTWHTNRELKGIGNPKRKITLAVLFPPEELLGELEAEAKDDPSAALGAPHAVGPDDIVLEAEDAQLVGSVNRVEDAHASHGAAIEFSQTGPESRPDVLESGIQLDFEAPKGTYHVWVRLKALPSATHDSLWIAFDGLAEGDMVDAQSGIGALPSQYPNGAFAWSGSALPGPTIKLGRKSPHTLYIAPREGPVVVDQIWLSRERGETPLFHEPVAK